VSTHDGQPEMMSRQWADGRDASSGGMWHALKGYKRCIIPAQG
jgi:hypothetical protein